MAEVIRYVDPSATGAGDGTSWTDAYTSLNAWESAEQTNLVSAGDWHHVYVRSSGGTADTTVVSIDGWTTGAANYILVEATSGHEALKTGWTTARYRMSITDNNPIFIWMDYVRIKGLQLEVIYSGDNNHYCIGTNLQASASSVLIDSCFLQGDSNALSNTKGLNISEADLKLDIQNTIIYRHDAQGIVVNSVDVLRIYNCIVYNCDDGIEIDAATTSVTIKNTASFNNTNDFKDTWGSAVVDYCASDDNDGTNNVAESGGGAAWPNDFNDAANGDFTLLTGSNLKAGGTTSIATVDIEGDTWGDPASVGVDEFVAAGGSTAVTIVDGLSMGDSVSNLAGRKAIVTDGVVISDSNLMLASLKAIVSDGVVISDSVQQRIARVMAISDGIVLSDSTAGKRSLKMYLSDGVQMSDAISTVAAYLMAIQDGVTLSDVTTSVSAGDITGLVTVTVTAGAASVAITATAAGASITGTAPGTEVS